MRPSWVLAVGIFCVGGLFSCSSSRSVNKENQLADKVVHLGDTLAFHFRLIPKGTFTMGSPEQEIDRDADEGPIHQVRISRDFYLGKFEVTQAQWKAVMGYNPAIFQQQSTHLQHPVESVSWSACQTFIEKLNQLGIGHFRLPTEAEWEYACRAGTQSRYYWGEGKQEKEANEYGWINSRSFAMTHPVGQKKPNAWGLYDMNGNVWEWCQDWYGPYASSKQRDPQGPDTGKNKVFRGGSWFDFAPTQRSANRHRHGLEKAYTAIGLRLVWSEKQ